MIENAQQLLFNVADGLAWLVQGIAISKGLAGCFAVVFAVLWFATMRHEPVEPPRCSDGK